MENPLSRPEAVNIIAEAIDKHSKLCLIEGWCGPSLEMFIYYALEENELINKS